VARKTKNKNPLTVIGRHGRYPFQTGMVTASLLRRGLPMADAVEVARAVRDAVDNKSEISTEKLTTRILAQVERRLGADVAARIKAAREREDTVPMVETARGRIPFSNGDMMRLLETAGLRLDEAIALVGDLDRWMRGHPDGSLTDERVHDEVARKLHAAHGESCARRFRLITWVRRSKAPLVILIGGATGTGKSTLAMELAYRLGVVWVTSTDLIRETMRTVLSAEIVPGLHDHSFRGMLVGGQVLSDPRERVLAGFHQQAAQVGVGVRAVIRRAIIENTHIIIEGTHLTPPFRQYIPEGTNAQVAAFLLAVPDEVRHRKRFPQRAIKEPRRAASTYLEAFQSVRWIHDDLLRMAEDEEAVVLPNDKLGKTLTGAVDFLSRELPLTSDHPPHIQSVPPRSPEIPTLFLILDGLADEPCEPLGGKTPLEAADKPTLRRLAGTGGQGQIWTGSVEGRPPSTNEGILGLLGAPGDLDPIGRGLFEALGRGVSIPPGAILLRGNLATVDADGHVVDRRAGRIRAGVAELLAGLSQVSLGDGISARILPGHEHRVVVVLTGTGLSTAVSDTDPGERAAVQRVLPVQPLDDAPDAARTAHALQKLLDVASAALATHPVNAERRLRGLHPANALLTRGAAVAPQPRPPRTDRDAAMVSGCNTALGVARYLGLKTVTSPSMTGNLDTDLDAKLSAAGDLLGDCELVVVHIKGTDIAAHDRKPIEKRDFISAIDAALGRFLVAHPELDGKLRVVLSADHGTSSNTGNHMPGPVPLLITTWRADSTEEQDFDEETAARGALGLLQPGELTRLLGFDAMT
jgi:2,3-bisphosphoglycerate-independent phosphoglycerate mutase